MGHYRLKIENAETGGPIAGYPAAIHSVETDLAMVIALGGEDDEGSAWMNAVLANGEFNDKTFQGLIASFFMNCQQMAEAEPDSSAAITAALWGQMVRYLRRTMSREKVVQFAMLSLAVRPEEFDE
jgi:hypothetical protein